MTVVCGMDARDLAGNRLYGDLAWLLPVISPPEDYAEEAAHWLQVLREHLGERRGILLELGVGGGLNLSHLVGAYDAVAVDLSPAMLEQCSHRLPNVELHEGDMREVRLGRVFDAVLVHDAISYMRTPDDLRGVFETAAAHLAPGGLVVVSPDYFAETFSSPRVEHSHHNAGDAVVDYVEYSHKMAEDTVEIIMTFYIRERERVRMEMDRHLFGLFPESVWIESMREAGFDATQRRFQLEELGETPYTLLTGTKK